MNHLHIAGAQGGQKTRRLLEVELRIGGLDHEHKFVVGHIRKVLGIEDRVVVPRKAVQREHADHGAEGRAKNRQLEHHGYRELPRKQWLAADHQGIADGADEPDHEDGIQQAEQTAGGDDVAQERHAGTDGIVDTVHGKRRQGVEFFEAEFVVEFPAGFDERIRIVELRHHAVDLRFLWPVSSGA